MTDIIKYKCPILNTDEAELDVLVKLSDSKILGIICPEYDSSQSLCKNRSVQFDNKQEQIDEIREQYSPKNFKDTEEYVETRAGLIKEHKFHNFMMKNEDKQNLEKMIDKKRIELMNDELKKYEDYNVKCILAEGFKELK